MDALSTIIRMQTTFNELKKICLLLSIKFKSPRLGRAITPFARMGGKSRIAKKLIAMFPRHKKYVECFVGAGNIYFRKPKAETNVINDLDDDVYTVMKGLQEGGITVKRELMSKEYWTTLKGKTDASSIIERLKGSFFGMGRSYNKNLHPIKTDYTKFIEPLRDVIILNQSFEAVIKKHDGKDTFLYLDPPYESPKQKDYKDYVHPIDVYKAVSKIKGKFMISYNDSPNIRETFKEFNIQEIETSYCATKYVSRRKKTELIITNYTL